MKPQRASMFSLEILRPAVISSLVKLDPRVQVRNPVMFVVWVVSVLTTLLGVHALAGHGEPSGGGAAFILMISAWLVGI